MELKARDFATIEALNEATSTAESGGTTQEVVEHRCVCRMGVDRRGGGGKTRGERSQAQPRRRRAHKGDGLRGGSMGGAGSRLAPVIDVYGPWQGREGVALSKRVDMRGSRGGYTSRVHFSENYLFNGPRLEMRIRYRIIAAAWVHDGAMIE